MSAQIQQRGMSMQNVQQQGGLQLSGTTNSVGITPAIGVTPLYDRQYITLHNLLEREMRQRLESERMIRDDMTQLQEGMARITNAIQEVATDIKGNLPRLFQETRELRRETQQLTMAYNGAVAEINNVRELVNNNKGETDGRIQANENKASDEKLQDRQDKSEMWNKLCTKQVVQDLADKVGCMDMETHAKFIERGQAHEDALHRILDMETKVQSSLEEFLKGINKCDYLYTQCKESNAQFKDASEKVSAEHREMIDTIIFPRIEKCESQVAGEMAERVDCLKKIAHELVHSKEQTDRVKEQVERLAVDMQTRDTAQVGGSNVSYSPLDRSLKDSTAMSRGVSPMAVPQLPLLLQQTPMRSSSVTPRLQGILPIRMSTGQSVEYSGNLPSNGSLAIGSVMIGGKVYPPGTRVISSSTPRG